MLQKDGGDGSGAPVTRVGLKRRAPRQKSAGHAPAIDPKFVNKRKCQAVKFRQKFKINAGRNFL